jgi:hypothetical protein
MTITELAQKHKAHDVAATETLVTVAFPASILATQFIEELELVEDLQGETLCDDFRWLSAWEIEIYL